jgi:NAD(P)-dependent dehydrogenase (short-subunit alcohol dehydrogenase family)
MEVSFSGDDLALFRAASHDRNPLHEEGERARCGPYGGPVAFGALGVLATLAVLPAPEATRLRGLRAAFHRPIFPGHRYALTARATGASRLEAVIADGGRPLAQVVFNLGEGKGGRAPATVPASEVDRARPREWDFQKIPAGRRVSGSYGPDGRPLRCLLRRLGLAPEGLEGYTLASVLFASYLVGMELPGNRGLLSSLRISLPQAEPGAAALPLSYEAEALEVDPRLGLVKVGATLRHGGAEPVARLSCSAGIRERPVTLDRRRRVGVVAGSAGAIGGAAVVGMASLGCRVYAVSRDGASGGDGHDLVESVAGDCADPRAMGELGARIEREAGRLDFLVCAAAPALRPLHLHAHAVDRFLRFVGDSLKLVAVPVSTFSPALEASGGCCLVPSSTAIETLPPDWDHYVTAKAGAEAMVAAASRSWARVEFVVTRLPMVRTERIGLLAKQEDSVELEVAAAHLLNRLTSPRRPGMHDVRGGAGR